MRKQFAQLQRIDHDRNITKDTDWEFLYPLQNGLLLALRERGTLNVTQFRQAEEKLRQQRRDRAKKLSHKGGTP